MQDPLDRQMKPRLRPGALLAPADQGRWQVRWDFDEVTLLEGDACREVLPWLSTRLDGTRSLVELFELPDCPCSPQRLNDVLDALIEQGFVIDADRIGDKDLDYVRNANVVVVGRSSLADFVLQALRKQGFVQAVQRRCWSDEPACSNNPTNSGTRNSLSIVVEADFTTSELEEMNQRAIAKRTCWMLVGAWNRRVLVGPIFMPGHTACYKCYRLRLDSHRRHLAAHQALDAWQRSQAAPPAELTSAQPTLPAVALLAAAWAAVESFAYFSRAWPLRTLGRVLVYDPQLAQLTTERVLRLPWCPCCTMYGPIVGERQPLPRPAPVSEP